jgi:3-oxoacyl-[acyl-carrier protein] reductase
MSDSTRFDLGGRVVIVTGGGSGIGKIYSQQLAACGAAVVTADLMAEHADGAAAEIRAAGGQAVGVAVDIADEAATLRMAQQAITSFGRIDGLVNNAALMSTLPRRPWHEIPVDEWDRVMAVNLRGMFLCCRAVHDQMRKQGSGSIINVSSNRVFAGTPNRLHYTTSKAGVIGFTRALAREVGEHGIRVNAIAPGLTLSETQLASSSPAYLAELAQGRALVRPQVPDDLVGTVLFLLSDASSYITGQTMNIDGGKMMH